MIIHGKFLKAVALFVNKKDVRHYLRGVHVEANGDTAILTATDGSTLISCRVSVEPSTPSMVFTIPLELVGHIKANSDVEVTLIPAQEETGLPSVTLAQGGVTVSDTVVAGTFPPYRKVVPMSLTGEQKWGCDIVYLSRAAAACKLINGKSLQIVRLVHNSGDVESFCTDNPDVLILIATNKTEEQPYNRPGWLGL